MRCYYLWMLKEYTLQNQMEPVAMSKLQVGTFKESEGNVHMADWRHLTSHSVKTPASPTSTILSWQTKVDWACLQGPFCTI